MDKFLVVGLGNSGKEYEKTRHNIGFKIVDSLINNFQSSFELAKHGYIAQFKIKGHEVIVLKPTTFMNLSGKAVRYYLLSNKIKIDHLLVISDDLNLPFGKIKIKQKGSHGGHNGHKDIIEKINTSHYSRLKFGIDNNFHAGQQSKYVLNKWSEEEENKLASFVHTSVDAIINFCTLGVDKTMSDFN